MSAQNLTPVLLKSSDRSTPKPFLLPRNLIFKICLSFLLLLSKREKERIKTRNSEIDKASIIA